MRSIRNRALFTTGDISQMYGFSPALVAGLIDRQELKGFRLPGSIDRRVARDDLIAYLREKQIPLGDLEPRIPEIMLVSNDCQLGAELEKGLSGLKCNLHFARDFFSTGFLFKQLDPEVVIVDFAMNKYRAVKVFQAVHQHNGRLSKVVLLSVLGDTPDAKKAIPRSFLVDCFARPFDPQLLARHVKSKLARNGHGIY